MAKKVLQNIVGNLKTRILLIVFLTILGITSFFIVFGYFNQLANYEEGVLNQLMGVVSGLGSEIDGDKHQDLTSKYPWRDDISSYGQDHLYDDLIKPLIETQKANNLSSKIFTMFYDEEERIFIYVLSSDTTDLIYRHKYEMYPDILLEKMNIGGEIDRYESETGEWLSSFYPIKNSKGETVGLIQADMEFGTFRKKAFDNFKTQALISFIVILVIALVLYPYVRSILREDEELKIALLEQKHLIEERNKDLGESLNYASQIQETMLPSQELFESLLPKSFVFYQPKEKVSGDYYWIKKLDKKVLIALSDCSGHGIPGALMSMIGLSKLTSIVDHHPAYNSNQILDELDRQVSESLTVKSYRTESTDSMEVGVCEIDLDNKKVQFSGALIDLFHISNGEIIEYKGDRFPIAGGDSFEKQPFKAIEIEVKEGDEFYLLSDGYSDQFGGPKQKKFMQKNVKNLLLELQSHSIIEKQTILASKFNEWKGELEQVDDVLVIGFTI